jgi:hypothetical protein
LEDEDVESEAPYKIPLNEEMKSGSAELDILSAGVTTYGTEDELSLRRNPTSSLQLLSTLRRWMNTYNPPSLRMSTGQTFLVSQMRRRI